MIISSHRLDGPACQEVYMSNDVMDVLLLAVMLIVALSAAVNISFDNKPSENKEDDDF